MRFPSDRFGVELHLHLDGSFRASTIFKYAKAKGIKLPCSTESDFAEFLIVKSPQNLKNYLRSFEFMLPAVAGDPVALTELTTHFVEDCATKAGLCYAEARFSPHLLAGPNLNPEMVVKTIITAVDSASKIYNINLRLILCMLKDKPEWCAEVVRLAKCYRNQGVVGVDSAGDDKFCDGTNTPTEFKVAFKEAKDAGLRITIHAGENGQAAAVAEAVKEMFAERIGHGYHVLDDASIYEDMKKRNVHFEVCPLSSRMTGSVSMDWAKHPIHRFIADSVNFSINTDGPTLNGQWKADEDRMVQREIGLTQKQCQEANLRAAAAAFLPENEKNELIRHVQSRY